MDSIQPVQRPWVIGNDADALVGQPLAPSPPPTRHAVRSFTLSDVKVDSLETNAMLLVGTCIEARKRDFYPRVYGVLPISITADTQFEKLRLSLCAADCLPRIRFPAGFY
jgi:hypothetical protein